MTYRALGQEPDPFDHRDYAYSAVAPRLRMLPMVTDTLASEVKDQDHLGACVFHSIPTAMESLMLILQMSCWFQLSPLQAYYVYRKLYGDIHKDEGAIIRVALAMIAKLGICKEDLWPYIPANFAVAPPPECAKDALNHQILKYYALNSQIDRYTRLATGGGFVCGIPVYENFDEATDNKGLVPMPGGKFEGGHAIYVKGYNRYPKSSGDFYADTYKCRNSWGTAWGKDGDFYLPTAYVEKYANSFWAVELIEDNP
jgi:hypothetical protein